jgi:hypothetical protein
MKPSVDGQRVVIFEMFHYHVELVCHCLSLPRFGRNYRFGPVCISCTTTLSDLCAKRLVAKAAETTEVFSGPKSGWWLNVARLPELVGR